MTMAPRTRTPSLKSELLLKAAKVTRDPDKRFGYMRQFRAEQLRGRIEKCRHCDLASLSTQRVPWSGAVPAQVAVVGEAPGRVEDRRGEPFVGKAGELLRDGLKDAGFERVFYFNTICCRPPSNDYTIAKRVGAPEHCRGWFEQQLEASGAWLIVVAGGSALKATLDMNGISSVRGKPRWTDGRVWFPIKHPAWYLRNRDKLQELYDDLHHARELVTGYQNLPFHPRDEDWGELKEMPEHNVKEVLKKNNGWVLVYSHVLQEQLVVVRHQDVVVPEQVAELPRYTLEEVARMRELGKGTRLPREQIRIVHNLKKELGATFLADLS